LVRSRRRHARCRQFNHLCMIDADDVAAAAATATAAAVSAAVAPALQCSGRGIAITGTEAS
jgi:hypothetical protein